MAEAKIVLSAVDTTKAAFNSAKRNLQGLGEYASTLPAKFGTLGLALAAVFEGATVKGAIDALDRLDDLAEKSGIATKELASLRYAAEVSDTSFDSLATGVRKLAVNMSSAAAGGKEQAAVFKAIGFEVRNAATGGLKDGGRALEELADKFASFRDSPEKAALAIAIFGRSGAEMIPVLNQGGAGIRALKQEAQQLGVAYGGELAKAASDFNDNLKRITFSLEAGKVAIAAEVLPTLNQLLQQFVDLRREGGGVSLMGEALRSTLQTIAVLGSDVAFVFKGIGAEIGAIAAQASALVRNVPKEFLAGGPLGLMAGIGVSASGAGGREAAAIREALIADGKERRKALDDYQRSIMLGLNSNAGGGRGFVNPPLANGDGKGNAPFVPKGGQGAPDNTAANYLAQLTKEFNSLAGAASKYQEVEEHLRIYAGKFSDDQRSQALAIAQRIDAAKRATDAVEQMARSQVAQLEAEERVTDAHYAAIGVLEQLAQQEQFEVSLLGLTAEAAEKARFQRDLANKERVAEAALVAAGNQLGWDEVRVNAERAKITRELTDATAAFNRRQAEARDKAYSPSRGVDDALRDYREKLDRTGDAARDATSRTLESMEDTLVEFARTGKLSISGLVNTIIAEMTRLQVVRPLMRSLFGDGGAGSGFLQALFGGGFGGAQAAFSQTSIGSSGFGTGLAYGNQDFGGFLADGGRAEAGVPYIVGERRPELFIPDSSGTVVPFVPQQSRGNGGVTVHITQHNTFGSDISRSEVAAGMQQARKLAVRDVVDGKRRGRFS